MCRELDGGVYRTGSYGVIMYEIPGAKDSTGNTEHCTQKYSRFISSNFKDRIEYSL